MKRLIITMSALAAIGSAHATCGVNTIKNPRTGMCEGVQVAQQAQLPSIAQGQQQAQGQAMSQGQAAAGYGGTSINDMTNRAVSLAFAGFTPSQAAPLPPGYCDDAKSDAWSIGLVFGFFNYSTASSRKTTDMECLALLMRRNEVVAQAVASAPIAQMPLTGPIHPPKKKRRAIAAKKPCPAGQALVCRPANGA